MNVVVNATSNENVAPQKPAGDKPSSLSAHSCLRYPESLLAVRTSAGCFTINDFDIVPTSLGAGKFGRVFKARERKTRRVVCLKQVAKRALFEEGVVRQFEREVETHVRLSHRNILRMFAYFHDEDNCYLVLEYANGGTLYDRLASLPQRRTTERAAACYVRQLCSALAYCHARNILHRDIKPENLLLFLEPAQSGATAAQSVELLKLADFGWTVAQRKNAQRTTLCGTPEYLPPELCETVYGGENIAYGTAFDMYTVGVLLYEMLVGTSPYASPDPAQMELESLQRRILEGSFRMPVSITSSAQSLIRALLERKPEVRPTAADVLVHPWVVRHAGVTEKVEWELR
jgi:aurora kinase